MKYKVHLVSDVVIDVEAENFYIYDNSYIFGSSDCIVSMTHYVKVEANKAKYVFASENVSYITKAD